jgi:hypothetical protein
MRTIYKKSRDWLSIFMYFLVAVFIIGLLYFFAWGIVCAIKHEQDDDAYICVNNVLYYKKTNGAYAACLSEHLFSHNELVQCVNKSSS